MDSTSVFRLTALAVPRDHDAKPSAAPPLSAGLTEPSDEDLMVEICTGSREALGMLFRRYARLVRAISLRILRDESEADDLLQDLFLFLFRNCSVFDPARATARAWIVRMTYQRAFDRRRYLNARHFYSRLDLDAIAPGDEYDAQAETHLSAAMVGNPTTGGLLAALSEDQRNTLSLHFYDGYSFAEIAVKLGQSVGNIRNHYYRGLDKLRKQMFSAKASGRSGCGTK